MLSRAKLCNYVNPGHSEKVYIGYELPFSGAEAAIPMLIRASLITKPLSVDDLICYFCFKTIIHFDSSSRFSVASFEYFSSRYITEGKFSIQ